MSELKATTAQEIVQNEKDCDYMDELFGGVKMPPTQVYLKSEADAVIAEKDKVLEEKDEVIRRLKHSLWKLKALYFYRMFQWSMEGRRFAPEDDEPEDFFMECMGKHTKRKSEWGKEADMFDDARIVCIKKAEEFK